MNTLADLHQHAQPLYGFVYKYFERMTEHQATDLRYDFIMTPIELYQIATEIQAAVPELLKKTAVEAEIMDLWAHKELVLKALVVLTNVPSMFESMEHHGLLHTAVTQRDNLIDEFTQKAIEDPNVLVAIQNGTIDDEIERLREAKELYNFKPLFEQHRSLVINPQGMHFQDIPERF